jgi:rod shape determining protein RodA
MATRNDSLWKTLDWVTILIYVVLLVAGWLSVCGASYDYGDRDFFDFSTRAGKQFIWILCSAGLGFVLLMLEDRLYDVFAYILYGAMLLLLFVTIFVAKDVKGSHSWLQLGPVSLQPAEFAKFATALTLAKFMNTYQFTIKNMKSFATCVAIVVVPMLLIIMQRETGSALVYLAFFLVFYREGMPGVILFAGLCAVFYFVVELRYAQDLLFGTPTPVGEFVVLLFVIVCSGVMPWSYNKRFEPMRNIVYGGVGIVVLAILVSRFIIPFNVAWVEIGVCVVIALYLLYLSLAERQRMYAFVSIFTVCSMAFIYSADYVFDNVLEPHQQIRIKVVLGLEDDPTGAGYNVNQSKIAIGSGGLTGKGFLNGTQTKLKYVPEQDTDFIFCTIGEEQGFVGSAAVLVLFLLLILRLIVLAERQPNSFGRVYGYSVVSIFLFHLFINVGMVLGLTPVIGIPLPFFSYGGSSLWGFTLLLFIFLRIDAGNKNHF